MITAVSDDAFPTAIVVSSDGLMGSALSMILSGESGRPVELVASIESAMAACAKRTSAGETPVIVFDLSPSELPGFETRAALAAANAQAPVIVVAPAEPFGRLRDLFELGVRGIVGRDAEPEELVRAVIETAKKETVEKNVFVSRRVLNRLVEHVIRCPIRTVGAAGRELELLAPREREIVQLLTRGMTNREIAAELHLSEATVKAHLGRVMTKWQVRDRLQVVLRALNRIP
ncbi:Transcriptional regulatory protein DegU [Microbacterium sp. 8M]|nr:Transcriptional regulatory protein DegU [Microbacterium sp. 8M]